MSTPSTPTLGTYIRHPKTGPPTRHNVRVLARTRAGYVIEYAKGNSLAFRRDVVLSKNLTVHGGN